MYSFFALFQCDLAARNVLVTHDLNVKIADFGHSERDYFEMETRNARQRRQSFLSKQPVCWVAYEVLQCKTKSYESDLWSFGVFMWEVFEIGKGKPYEFLRDDKGKVTPQALLEYLNEGSRLPQPENCPDDVYDLMFLCWNVEPNKRPSFRHLKMELESYELMLNQTRIRRASEASTYSNRAHLNNMNTQTSYVSMGPTHQPFNAQSSLLYSALMDANENLAIL